MHTKTPQPAVSILLSNPITPQKV